jgi:hypothetical protein
VSSIEANVGFALAAQARQTAAHIVKQRARRYARQPSLMDSLYAGLSVAPAATMIAIARHLIEQERHNPAAWFVRGGEVHLINLHAILLLGRTWRRPNGPPAWHG